MKKLFFPTLLGILIFFSNACTNEKAASIDDLKDAADSVSFYFGLNIGQGLVVQSGLKELDPDILAAGIKAVIEESDSLPSDMEIQMFLQGYMMELQQRVADEELEIGEEFLEKNKKNKDVIETESGLQYEILVEGTGKQPTAEDNVRCHYKGMLIDGTEFDSSYERGEPSTFALNRVVRGWTEGIALMKEGAKYKFYIPGDLGYGPRGNPQAGIKPNSVLIFEVELIEVMPKSEGENPLMPTQQ